MSRGPRMSRDSQYGNFSAVAAAFLVHQHMRLKMFRPLTIAMCREAAVPEMAPASEYVLLDVAGGTGDVALDVTVGLGPHATIWCVDMVSEMVANAAEAAAAAGLTNMHCKESRAESLSFEDATFDAVLCRFGIMFFSEPEKSVREALRVLKPGGRVAYGVWGARVANPFHSVLLDVLDRHVDRPPPDPDAPGAFRHAVSGKLVDILRGAGAADVRETTFRFNIELPSFQRYFEMRTGTSETLLEKLRRMPDAEREQFTNEVERGARQYLTSDGISFPVETLIVSGARMNPG
ncbi:MAG: class I SAM-dependent methyltransferase [Pirellulaceae bacterium]